MVWETKEALRRIYTADMSVRELKSDLETADLFEKLFPWAEMTPPELLDKSVREVAREKNLPVPEEKFEELDRALKEL